MCSLKKRGALFSMCPLLILFSLIIRNCTSATTILTCDNPIRQKWKCPNFCRLRIMTKASWSITYFIPRCIISLGSHQEFFWRDWTPSVVISKLFSSQGSLCVWKKNILFCLSALVHKFRSTLSEPTSMAGQIFSNLQTASKQRDVSGGSHVHSINPKEHHHVRLIDATSTEEHGDSDYHGKWFAWHSLNSVLCTGTWSSESVL